MHGPFSIYLHIPYCHHKCPYCDFNTYAVTSAPEKEYGSALLCELDYRASLPEWRGRTVKTIFFGGGTPSLMSPNTIKRILAGIFQRFPIDDAVEISLEANPGNLSFENVEGLREAGVNRLSLGSQSFNPETLKTLGRIHTPDQIDASVVSARKAGFRNINLDLIYGVPGQSVLDVENDLRKALKLGPEHISTYGLTIEKGTPFFQSWKRGTLHPPPEEAVIEMMDEIEHLLSCNEFQRYEISNYSRPGREARHNLTYWNAEDYLGVGAGAHSYFAHPRGAKISGERWSNFALPGKYMGEVISKGSAESWSDDLDLKSGIFEFLFLGLRKIAGVDLRIFEERFGYGIKELYPARLEILTDQGLIQLDHSHLRLAPKGLPLADSITEEFVEPEIMPVSRPIQLVEPLASGGLTEGIPVAVNA